MLIDLFLYSEHDFKRLGHQYKIEEAKAYYNRGKTLQELKRFDEALGSYDTAALIHPRGYPEAWNNIGNIMQEIGRFDQALGNYNLAIRHNLIMPMRILINLYFYFLRVNIQKGGSSISGDFYKKIKLTLFAHINNLCG